MSVIVGKKSRKKFLKKWHVFYVSYRNPICNLNLFKHIGKANILLYYMWKRSRCPRQAGVKVAVWACPRSLVDFTEVLTNRCLTDWRAMWHLSRERLGWQAATDWGRGLCFDEEIAKTHVSLVFPKVLWKWTTV